MNSFKKSFVGIFILFSFVLSTVLIPADKVDAGVPITVIVTANDVSGALSVTQGTEVKINWESFGDSGRTCTNNFGGSNTQSGEYRFTANTLGSTTYTVTCSNAPCISGSTISTSWTAPTDIENCTVKIEVYGGGGGGAGGGGSTAGYIQAGGGGGGGGGYSYVTKNLSAGNVISTSRGAGGAGGAGANSSGGNPSNGSSGGSTVAYLNGSSIVTAGGGQGGCHAVNGCSVALGGSGNSANGGNSTMPTAHDGTTGGAGAGPSGGIGGIGGTQGAWKSAGNPGGDGGYYGGGGGGGGSAGNRGDFCLISCSHSGGSGGAGQRGQVKIWWY